MTFVFNGERFETDEEGYLMNPDDWSVEIAEFMAHEDSCYLTENHWVVIHLIRNYYCEYEVAQGIRLLVKQVGKQLGKDKANSRYLYHLFPYGPATQACKYAGLPKRSVCI